ncbi:hypothetical protein FRC07_000675, partial [Ceratobasidium sp. 392]
MLLRQRGIEREIEFLRLKEQKRGLSRFVKATQDADQVIKCYRRIQTLLERLALNANVNIWISVDEQVARYRLDRLNPSHAAWYSSAESQELYRDECTADTRVEVLEQFRVWRDDEQGEKVYWLNGMAGTGKTTLSYTLCKQLEEGNRLAASFFCSRQIPNCRDPRHILPTIAYQLANFSYPFRYALSQILEQTPDVHTRRITEQFTKLLYRPLCEVRTSMPHDLVVVIEALDECNRPRDVGEILNLVIGHAPELPIKFFLTSRPEPAIRERMCARRGNRERFELYLHNIDKKVVQDDIRKYLQVALKPARISVEELETLTERSGALFIHAATVVRYIGAFDFSKSADRIGRILRASTLSQGHDKWINAIYELILTEAFEDPDLECEEREEMQLVLYTVICAQQPLNARAMASFLGLKGEYSVHAALSPLRSVLNVQTTNEDITTLHKSFPDYMFDPDRSKKFYCDWKKHHLKLAERCFSLINSSNPPFNICHLKSSYLLDEDVPNLDEIVDRNISKELFYACRYWSTHLALGARAPLLQNAIQNFLSARLLLWMEVMNLKRCLRSNGVVMIFRLMEHVERKEPAVRPLETVPLAIYSFGDDVLSIAFSPNSTNVAAGSTGATVRIWDARTGLPNRVPLKGHTGPVCSIAYSPDGERIATGSADGSIRIWKADADPAVDASSHTSSRRHTGSVYSVAYSHYGEYITSGSADSSLIEWDASTGHALGIFCGHSGPVHAVAYSPTANYIASGSTDAIRIWDQYRRQTVLAVPVLAPIFSITFSPDGRHLATGSADATIRTWDAPIDQGPGWASPVYDEPVYSFTYPEFSLSSRARFEFGIERYLTRTE